MERESTSTEKTLRSQAESHGLASLYAAAPRPYRRLGKHEHLCRKRLIDYLFARNGSDVLALSRFPLRALLRPVPEALQLPDESPVEVLFSVSKRSFKRAVRRNRAKRQMREAYRLQRHTFMGAAENSGLRYALAFVWLGKAPCSTAQVAHAMSEILSHFAEKLHANSATPATPPAHTPDAPAEPCPQP